MNAVMLIDPKYAHNVATVLRASAVFGMDALYWTGDRVPAPDAWPEGSRMPREERMKLYRHVQMEHVRDAARNWMPNMPTTLVPVAVERRECSEGLIDFDHPRNALYVFGPEDGSLPRSVLAGCHRFVRIPAHAEMENVPLNLAAAVNVVLYDRMAKAQREADEEIARLGQALAEWGEDARA